MLQQPPMPPQRRSEQDQSRGRKRSRCPAPAGSVLGPLSSRTLRRWAVQCLLVVLLRPSPPPSANAFSPLHMPEIDNRHSTLVSLNQHDIGLQGRGIEGGAGMTNRKSTFSLSSKRSNGPTTGRLWAAFASFDGSNNSRDEWRSRRRNQGTGKKRRRGYRNGAGFAGKKTKKTKDDELAKRNWLEQATNDICSSSTNDTSSADDLAMGKWHQVVSLIRAWSQFRKGSGPTPALRMEALLTVLLRAKYEHGNENIVIDIELYNTILNAWTCAALFGNTDIDDQEGHGASSSSTTSQTTTQTQSLAACIRAKEMVRYLQRDGGTILPNEYSFDVVLHAVLKVQGALEARRFLAWMEYLYKTGKNVHAKPTSGDYIQILEEYAKWPSKQSGLLADGFLTHMEKYLHETTTTTSLGGDGGVGPYDHDDVGFPSTICYNIALKAWGNARKYGLSGREIAEQADRIVDHMKRRDSNTCRPDKFTYSACISMWAASGMKSHAVNRVEQILREMDETDVEPNTVILNAVMNAYTQSQKVGAVERTAELLVIMEQSCPESADLQPDLMSYNTHLHALSVNASPQRPELAAQAEDLLERMVRRHRDGKLASPPNLFSYNLVLKALLNARPPDVSWRMTQFLRTLTQHVKPDVTSFNRVLASFSANGRPAEAEKALSLLRYMETSYQSGLYPKARPDPTSFANVLQAYANSDEAGAPDRAQALFDEMIDRANNNGESHLRPSKECYIAIIECWAKSQTGTRGARHAEALMGQMIERFEAGERELAPPLKTFNAILHAWAFSGTRGSGYQAEKHLNSMWEKFHAGKTTFRPNKVSYNTVIEAIAKSKNERKAQKALRMLRRMDQLYKAGNTDARPDEWSYACVLYSCASPSVKDPRIRRKALDTALFTYQELQNNSAYGKPTDVIYGTFIQACSILLDESDALRPALIRAVFQQCAIDGQVGRLVLQNIPKELFAELLPSSVLAKESIDLDDLPHDWRCNVVPTASPRGMIML